MQVWTFWYILLLCESPLFGTILEFLISDLKQNKGNKVKRKVSFLYCVANYNESRRLHFRSPLNILFTFRIFNNLRLPWKQSLPWKFSLYLMYFLLFRIFEQLALALVQNVPGKNGEISSSGTVYTHGKAAQSSSKDQVAWLPYLLDC